MIRVLILEDVELEYEQIESGVDAMFKNARMVRGGEWRNSYDVVWAKNLDEARAALEPRDNVPHLVVIDIVMYKTNIQEQPVESYIVTLLQNPPVNPNLMHIIIYSIVDIAQLRRSLSTLLRRPEIQSRVSVIDKYSPELFPDAIQMHLNALLLEVQHA